MACVLSGFLMFQQCIWPITNRFITHYNDLTVPHNVLKASKSYQHVHKVDGHFTGAQNQGGTGGTY